MKEHLGDFEDELKGLESRKDQSYFSDERAGELKKDSGRRTSKDLNARLLQFIFDRGKADDPLNLNEIYSHAKKYRQQQSTSEEKDEAKGKLEEVIKNSQLPDTLKTARDYQSDAIFGASSFLHLVCKYYKLRQKARDGRVFICERYATLFPEVLANNLYKKAKAISKQNLLSFDYFGVEAQSSSRGDGIYDLRKSYEKADPSIAQYAKRQDERQEAYSHLIDAQLAFVMVVDAHRKEGSLRINIPDGMNAEQNTGEISKDNLFKAIQVDETEMEEVNLERKRPDKTFFTLHLTYRLYILITSKTIIRPKDISHTMTGWNFCALLPIERRKRKLRSWKKPRRY